MGIENDFDFTWDFGYTTEEELKSGEVQQINDAQEKLIGLRKMIMPLLNNLKKNPDMDIIKWPGSERVKNIDAFIKKMDSYINN